MVDRDDVLLVTPTHHAHIRVHQNAAAERVATPVILPLIPPLFAYTRSTENGDHASALADVHSLLRRLVRTHNMGQLVLVQELRDRLVAEANRARTALTLAESAVVEPALLLTGRRVRPQQVACQLLDLLVSQLHSTHHRRLAIALHGAHRRGAGNASDALQSGGGGRERAGDAAVDAEDHVVDGGGEGKAVEYGVGDLPEADARLLAVLLLQLAQEAAISVVRLPAVVVKEEQ